MKDRLKHFKPIYEKLEALWKNEKLLLGGNLGAKLRLKLEPEYSDLVYDFYILSDFNDSKFKILDEKIINILSPKGVVLRREEEHKIVYMVFGHSPVSITKSIKLEHEPPFINRLYHIHELCSKEISGYSTNLELLIEGQKMIVPNQKIPLGIFYKRNVIVLTDKVIASFNLTILDDLEKIHGKPIITKIMYFNKYDFGDIVFYDSPKYHKFPVQKKGGVFIADSLTLLFHSSIDQETFGHLLTNSQKNGNLLIGNTFNKVNQSYH
jgi:hypothetical protein